MQRVQEYINCLLFIHIFALENLLLNKAML